MLRNWFWVTTAPRPAAAVAYFFGHLLGLTEGAFLHKTLAIAQAKVDADFLHAFISGVGCNWLVCPAVWLAFASKDVPGKVIGMWFPVMAFVAIGFQHVVANMFIIPAAIFAGGMGAVSAQFRRGISRQRAGRRRLCRADVFPRLPPGAAG